MAVKQPKSQLARIHSRSGYLPVRGRNNCHNNDGTKLSLERNGDGIWATTRALFQEIYEDHFQAQDDLAERIDQ